MVKRIVIGLLAFRAKALSFLYGFALPVSYRRSWLLRGRPLVVKHRQSAISIGERFTACSKSMFNSIGVFQRVFIRTCASGARIVIGDDVGMSGSSISAHRSVSIGNHVLIGSGVLITDSDAHPLDADKRRLGGNGAVAPVVIEDDAFIGARAIILKGVTVGRGAIVGAGSVVVRNVPPYSVVAGNPAVVVRQLADGEIR